MTTYRWRWLALTALLIAEAMNLLDSTIVTVAAPVIHERLGGSAADIQWYAAAYTLPFSVLLIAGGRLGDIFSRRSVFQAGVAGFVLTSTACALAPSAGFLIGARAAQGATAALIIPQTLGMIKEMFAGPEMAKAMGSIGPVMGLAAVCGPVLGGVLTHADLFGSSWRAVFLVNVPLGIVVLAASPLLRQPVAARKPGLDLVGNGLAIAGTALVVYPLVEGGNWIMIAGGAALLALLAWHQRERRGGLIAVSLFAHRGFPAALVTSVLFFSVISGLTLVVILRLQLGLHLDVLHAGLSLLPWSAAMAVSSLVAGGVLVPRFGARVMYAGLAILALGVVIYPHLTVADFVLLGAGQGIFAVPFFTTALHRVTPAEAGSAAGLLNAVQQLGATLGTAVLGTIFLRTNARGAFWAAAVVLALAAVTTHRMVRAGRAAEQETLSPQYSQPG